MRSDIARKTERTAERAGFTLIEILTVIAIIGLLSTVATVSYESARRGSRDAKRASDMRQLNTALELYFQNHNYYPGDGQAGPAGLVLGKDRVTALTEDGFVAEPKGQVYMVRLPANPEPNGLPYTYRSLTLDGKDCNDHVCDGYAVIFAFESSYGQLEAGAHAATPLGIVGPETASMAGVISSSGRIIGIESVQGSVAMTADNVTNTLVNFVENKTVRDAAAVGVAPAMTAVGVANTAVAVNTVASGTVAGHYLLYFLTQPLLLLKRRRRKFWGTVYNSLSRLPIDLAIVRLIDEDKGRVVRSEVTDKDGRFTFLVPEGRYRLETVKGGFVFPSEMTKGKQEDGPYVDVYHGETIEAGPDGASLTNNLPMDPEQAEVSNAEVIRQDRAKRLRGSIALISPLLGGGALALNPSWFTGLLFLLQVLVYLFFRRIAQPDQPKNWGVVFDQINGKPVYQAVVRIFALPYHKLLESKVTDRAGRYNFRVGQNEYYLTSTKKGFEKTQTEPVDFTETDKPSFIAADLPMRPKGYISADQPPSGEQSAAPAGQPAGQAGAQPPAAPSGETVESPAAPAGQPEAADHFSDILSDIVPPTSGEQDDNQPPKSDPGATGSNEPISPTAP